MSVLRPTTPKRAARARTRTLPLTLPAFRAPQLATLQAKVPVGENWLYEMKYDGYRCQAAILGREVRLYSRNGHDWSTQFGYVAPALAGLTRGSLLIDGEVCAIDADGRSDFTLLKNSLDGKSPIVFFAFDLLEQDGENVGLLPQIERKRRLAKLLADLPQDSPIHYSPHVEGRGEEVFNAMRAGGFEGVIAKWPEARYYEGGRSTAWFKVKCVRRQEFVVIGWRPPEYGTDDVRSLFLATYEAGRLVYRGSVGTGFTDMMRRETLAVLQLIRTKTAPTIDAMPRAEMRAARWVEPRLLAEVEFTEITPDGYVRHPSLKGLREDKDARTVKLEEA